jgi:phenylacetate-CoA ligase
MGAFSRQIIFPLWAWREHPHYFRYFEEFQRSQFFTQEEIRELQLRRLQALLQHAYENCPFYRSRMNEAGVSPASIRSLDDLRALPVLTKSNIQDFGPLMLAANIPEGARVRNQTGGSTGSPLQFYVDKERFDSRMASTDRHNRWAGLRPGDWQTSLWGARLDQVIEPGAKHYFRNTLLYRRIELNTSLITEDHWHKLISELRTKRPRFLVAYARSAVLLANYLRDNCITDISFDAIITTAEVLLAEERQLVEQVLGGKVFNRYGCREVSIIASECERHSMHVNAEALLIEIAVDDLHTTSGRVLITDLLNFSMPLIRYEVGDIASWAEAQECPCGRGLPILADIQGRTTDFLKLSDGRRISGPALTLVVADMPDVRQVQFVQHQLDQIELRVVPGNGYGEHTKAELRKRLSLYIGSSAQLNLQETARIPSEASGKYRFVISHLQAASPLASEKPHEVN